MPKIKYDVSNVDDSGGFEHVQPGMYIGKISEITLKDSKSGNGPMLEVILQPAKTADGKTVKPKDKKKQVARVYTYVLLEHEPSDWKLKEFIKAVGLKDKGMIDTDKLVGKEVQMNLKSDTDLNDQYRPRVGKLMALPNSAKASRSNSDTVEVEDEADDDLYTEYDLNELDESELLEVAEEFGIARPAGKMTPVKIKKLINAILAEQEAGEEEDEEEDEEEAEEEPEDEAEDEEDEEEDEEEDDLTELSRTELKAYIKENELDVTVKKSMTDDDIRTAIEEAMGGEEDEEDEEEEDEEEDEDEEPTDYNSWSIDALKKEAQERGLSTKGSKKILAGRLGKDDEDEENPF